MKAFFLFIVLFLFLATTVPAQDGRLVLQDRGVVFKTTYLRTTPSNKGKFAAKVYRHQHLEIISRSGAWYLVKIKKYTGWLHSDNIIFEIGLPKPIATPPQIASN